MVDVYLKRSIQQYQAVLDHAAQLEDLLKQGNPQKLVAYSVRLQELQDAAGLLDRDFFASVSRELSNWQTHPLYQERMQLLEQILAINADQLPKVSSMRAIAAAELNELRVGRGAVSGYGSTLKKKHRSSRGKG